MRKQPHTSKAEEWFNLYHFSLFTYGMGRWKNIPLVDDSIQDVFAKLILLEQNAPSTLECITEPLSYLKICLRHKVVDNLKKEQREAGLEAVSAEPMMAESIQENYCRDGRERLQYILRFFETLDLLPKAIPEILYLKSQGYNGREIDEKLQLGNGYSDTLLSRFKKRVSQYMNK